MADLLWRHRIWYHLLLLPYFVLILYNQESYFGFCNLIYEFDSWSGIAESYFFFY
uniref:Uncharacterized protein n=1 Tax=Arundo donax TaxID=35708 RepID=A0A0A9DV23_ARUDO